MAKLAWVALRDHNNIGVHVLHVDGQPRFRVVPYRKSWTIERREDDGWHQIRWRPRGARWSRARLARSPEAARTLAMRLAATEK